MERLSSIHSLRRRLSLDGIEEIAPYQRFRGRIPRPFRSFRMEMEMRRAFRWIFYSARQNEAGHCQSPAQSRVENIASAGGGPPFSRSLLGTAETPYSVQRGVTERQSPFFALVFQQIASASPIIPASAAGPSRAPFRTVAFSILAAAFIRCPSSLIGIYSHYRNKNRTRQQAPACPGRRSP